MGGLSSQFEGRCPDLEDELSAIGNNWSAALKGGSRILGVANGLGCVGIGTPGRLRPIVSTTPASASAKVTRLDLTRSKWIATLVPITASDTAT